MTYQTLGEILDKRSYRQRIAAALRGQTKSIGIGRSSNRAGFCRSTPIEHIDGDTPPVLVGQPYLKTQFRRGSFSKTLYTPSTLKVVVGREW